MAKHLVPDMLDKPLRSRRDSSYRYTTEAADLGILPQARSCSQAGTGMMIASTSAPSCLHHRIWNTQSRPLNPAVSIRGRRKEIRICRADADDAGSDKGTSSALGFLPYRVVELFNETNVST